LAVAYIVYPLLAALAIQIISTPDLQVGLAILAAAPPTLASATVLTYLARGNVKLALAISVAGNLLSIAATPVLMMGLIDAGGIAWVHLWRQLLFDIGVVVVVPVVIGMALRASSPAVAARLHGYVAVMGKCLIGFAVMLGVRQVFYAGSRAMPFPEIAVIAFIVATIHAIAVGIAYTASRVVRLAVEDRYSICFGGAQKTLPFGVYVAATHFPSFAYAAVPLIVMYPVQLVFDLVLARRIANRAPALR